MMDADLSSGNGISRWKVEPNPYITEDIIDHVMSEYFDDKLPVETVIITTDFQKQLLSNLREVEKAKYIIEVIPYPNAETIIPAEHGEGFKIVMDIDAYQDEFTAYLGLIHELCHARDLELFFRKYGYIHTKPLNILRRVNYPEFLIWSEYIAVKNSFEYCVDFFGKLHPYDSINLEIGLEVPEMHKTYHEIIAWEKKDPRFADAMKMESVILLERLLKIYFASNMAKIELNNESFREMVSARTIEPYGMMELQHFIIDTELRELGELLRASSSFESAIPNLKSMTACHIGILEKFKKII